MTTQTATTPEAEVRALLAARDRAVGMKDVDGIMACYVDDLVYFDAVPPFQSRDASGLRGGWESCLPHFPDRFGLTSEQLTVFVDGGVAGANWIWRFTDMPADEGAMQTCLRATAILARRGGDWKIVHEHCSVPFDPFTEKAVFSLTP